MKKRKKEGRRIKKRKNKRNVLTIKKKKKTCERIKNDQEKQNLKRQNTRKNKGEKKEFLNRTK